MNLVGEEDNSCKCHYCILQKLCIFDSFGTLVFAVFMGVWGKLYIYIYFFFFQFPFAS